jgi:hypothetical protein
MGEGLRPGDIGVIIETDPGANPKMASPPGLDSRPDPD